MFLNHDFLKQGHISVTIEDMTDFKVYMWHNLHVKDLEINHAHIPPAREECRRQTVAKVVSFCHVR